MARWGDGDQADYLGPPSCSKVNVDPKTGLPIGCSYGPDHDGPCWGMRKPTTVLDVVVVVLFVAAGVFVVGFILVGVVEWQTGLDVFGWLDQMTGV